jgi:phosphoglycolate phosphatase
MALRVDAIIFDFDGTLAELNIDFVRLREEIHRQAKRNGFSGPWPGGYLLEEVEVLAAELGDDFAGGAMETIQQAEMEAAARGRLFHYTRDLLVRARAQNYGLAVISRNCGPAIRLVFPEVDGNNVVFLPREAVKKPKPHPSHILAACLALRTSPARSAVVGDHPIDIAAALAAGCVAVGVASGRMSQEDLLAAGAALVLPDASSLLAGLDSLA